LLDEFLKRPHQRVSQLGGQIFGEAVRLADFSRLPTRARFIALMPQWDFLDFLALHARRSECFELRMEAEVSDLVRDGGRVAGVRAATKDGPLEVHSDLVVGADGRSSRVRERAGLAVDTFGAPMDVLWMRLRRHADDPAQTAGYIARGHLVVLLDRGDYWQCAFLIPKGEFERLRSAPIGELCAQLGAIVPFLAERALELRSWEDVKLLTVRVDRLRRWYEPGLLCIGDAAHAMSPIGGVGINLAIQDAVATANLLARRLRDGAPTTDELARVQRRRELPTRLTQAVQLRIQERFIGPTLAGTTSTVPRLARWLDRHAMLRHIPARLLGLGVRPEHIGPALRRGRANSG
jgi:2-polyprenyl-6-methoxyphenol hydroxylase-like FAD-dependent oxidoreductase